MIRFVLKLLALFALVAAVITAAVDATQSLALSQVAIMPLSEVWQNVDAESYAAAEAFLQANLPPTVWDPIMLWVFRQPAFAVFLFLSLLLFVISRKPRRREHRFST